MNVSGADRRGVGVVFGVVVGFAPVGALVRQLNARGVGGLGQCSSPSRAKYGSVFDAFLTQRK
jgi:hypothetical protein